MPPLGTLHRKGRKRQGGPSPPKNQIRTHHWLQCSQFHQCSYPHTPQPMHTYYRRKPGHHPKAPDTTPPSSDTRTKRQKLANLGTDDLDGYLVWTGEGNNMPLPTDLNSKDFSLCKVFWRKGSKCRFGHNCWHTHASFPDLSEQHQRMLYDFVTSNGNLAFNPNLIGDHLLSKFCNTTTTTPHE